MTGYLDLALTAVLWMVHFLLLLLINADVRERGLAAKFAVTIFAFYTLTLLVPFYDHEHFDYVVSYVPSAGSLFLGVCADLSMLAAIRWSFPVQAVPGLLRGQKAGFALLVAVAAVAQVIDIAMNRELLLLPKELYIEAEKLPNLLFFSIPAPLILLGGALYSPVQQDPGTVFDRRAGRRGDAAVGGAGLPRAGPDGGASLRLSTLAAPFAACAGPRHDGGR
jgi:hypothetical protein